MALEWSVDLGADEPRKRSIVGAVAIIVGIIGSLVFSPWYGLVGFSLVLGSTAELFLKQKYKVTDQGVERKCGLSSTVMEWEQVKSFCEDPEGVKLSPFGTPRRSDPFRGVYLRFGPNNRDSVLAKIHEHFNGDSRILGRGTSSGGAGETLSEGSAGDYEAPS